MKNAHVSGKNIIIKSSLVLEPVQLKALEQALFLTQAYLQSFANEPDFSQKMALAFGEGANVDSFGFAWSTGNFSDFPQIETRYAADINGANGAFATATNKIYLSQEFIAKYQGNVGAIARVLLEEFGHWVDTKINTTDAPGDEGAIFAAFVRGDGLNESQLHALKAEDDFATVYLDGNVVEIEQAVSYTEIDIAARGGGNFVNLLTVRNYKVLGSSENNLILVNSGNDLVYGRGGDDTIGGGLNDDALYGGAGNDIVAGNGGDDVLDGGGGKDILAGGGGDDIYRISLGSNSAGTIINDWGNHQNPLGLVNGGGEDTLVIYQEAFQENPTEDAEYKLKETYQNAVQILENRLQAGLIGSQRDGTTLVIDLNKDGVANKDQDLSILNFYNTDGSPGIGYIENINFSAGNIEVTISSNKDSIGIGSDHQATYTFDIANSGTQEATEVTLETTIPKGINIIGSSLPIINQIIDSAGNTLLTLDAGSIAQGSTFTGTVTIEATGFSQPLDKLLDYLWDINVEVTATGNVLEANVSSNTASISTQVDSSKGLAEDLVKELLYGSQANQNQAVARAETVETDTQTNVNSTSDISQPGLVNIGQDISNRFALKIGTRVNNIFEGVAGATEQELKNSGQFYNQETVENKISSFRLFGNVTNEFNLTYSQAGEDLKAAISESIKEAGISFLGKLGSKS